MQIDLQYARDALPMAERELNVLREEEEEEA